MNNFKDYGFEADFEGEICFENINGFLIGYANKPVGKIIKQWRKSDGQCFDMEGYIVEDYILKPIKKEWYENPDNFPCLVYMEDKRDEEDKGYYTVLGNMNSYKSEFLIANIIRPATEEEVLALLVKE